MLDRRAVIVNSSRKDLLDKIEELSLHHYKDFYIVNDDDSGDDRISVYLSEDHLFVNDGEESSKSSDLIESLLRQSLRAIGSSKSDRAKSVMDRLVKHLLYCEVQLDSERASGDNRLEYLEEVLVEEKSSFLSFLELRRVVDILYHQRFTSLMGSLDFIGLMDNYEDSISQSLLGLDEDMIGEDKIPCYHKGPRIYFDKSILDKKEWKNILVVCEDSLERHYEVPDVRVSSFTSVTVQVLEWLEFKHIDNLNEVMAWIDPGSSKSFNYVMVDSDHSELVYTEDNYVCFGSDDLFYCSYNDCYYYYDENMPHSSAAYNFDYHEVDTQYHSSAYGHSDYNVGFEVEKEDYDRMTSFYASDILHTTQYRKESDSSLDDDSGYELISPVYRFDVDIIRKDVESKADIVELLSGSGSAACGTHITLSRRGMTSTELFYKLANWLPLLYALYPSRTSVDFCNPKIGKEIYKYQKKYSSIFIKSDKIEIRIFPLTKNVEQLYWRLELIRILLDLNVASFNGIKKYCYSGRLRAHLLRIYNNDITKIDSLVARAYNYIGSYELSSSVREDNKQCKTIGG